MTSDRELTLDQRHALRSAAVALHQEFDGVFGVETIEEFLRSSYDGSPAVLAS